VIIELKCDVSVRTGSGFVTIPAGTKVNYSSTKRAPYHTVHRFVVRHRWQWIEHLTVTENASPADWL
jgi:hypothetical protein